MAPGILRVTLPLPMRPGHVHAYLLAEGDGWTLVDTGIGLPDATERWRSLLAPLPGAVETVFVSHMHPDHVGAAADVHELTGAPVVQGALDYAQCELVWGNDGWPERIAGWLRRHGVPAGVLEDLVAQGRLYRPFIRYRLDPLLVDPGATVGGWTAVPLPGHADGQLGLRRDGVLVGADHVLDPITPSIGLWPASRPDPLGDYLASLRALQADPPALILPGHGEPIRDPLTRIGELLAHHADRLAATRAALGIVPQSAYEVSMPLFGVELGDGARRFAVAETLSHVEHLVLRGEATRHESAGAVSYTAP